MAVTRYTPITDLLALHNAMDRLFSENFTGGRGRTELTTVGEGYVPLDVYQTDRAWVIRAGVPAADPESVEVTCDGNTITIKGEIRWPEGVKAENFWLRENYNGKFERRITLPDNARCDQSTAEFKDGMLMLTVPKAQPSKPPVKKIPVTAGTSESGQRQVPSGTGERQSTASAGERQPETAARK